MKLFFWGFLLIFLDFSLTINGVGFDLLPDAIGYLLVFLGARQMAEESEQFARMRPIALVLMIVGFVSLLLSPFGPIELTPGWPVILAATTVPLLLLMLDLCLLWLLVRGLQDMEQYYGCDFRARTIRMAVLVQIVISVASFVLLLAPALMLMVLLSLISMAAYIVLLVMLWQAAQAYARLCEGHARSDGNDDYYPGSED